MRLVVRAVRRSIRGMHGGSIVLLLATLVACGEGAAPTGEGIPGDLSLNRARWAQLGIVDYGYRLAVRCFCAVHPSDVVVEVRNGAIVAVQDQQSGEPLDPSRFGAYYTIEGLFDAAEQAIADGADRVDVLFHPELYYPVMIDIDRITNAIDDELRIEASGLVTR